MPILYEVFLDNSIEPEALLSEETKQETGAKLFRREQGERAGFQGLPFPDPGKGVQVFISVDHSGQRWIDRQLEHHGAVRGYAKREL